MTPSLKSPQLRVVLQLMVVDDEQSICWGLARLGESQLDAALRGKHFEYKFKLKPLRGE